MKKIYNILGGRRKSEDGSWKSEDRGRKSEDGKRKLEDRSRKTEVGRWKTEVGSRENYLGRLAGNGFIRPAGLEALPVEQKPQTSKGFIRPVGLGSLPAGKFLQSSRGFGRPVGVMTLPVGEFLQPSREFTRPVGQGSGKSEDRSRKLEDGRRKTEDGRMKTEVGSRKSEDGRRKWEAGFSSLLNHCSNLLAPLSTLAKGDEIRPLVAGSEGVVTPANVGKENKEHRIANDEYRMMNDESERNIPVRCTFGFHALSGTTNIVGATHLGTQTAVTTIGETAAEPRNLCGILLNHCSNFLAPLSTLAKGDEIRPLVAGLEGVERSELKTLKENNEYRPRESSWTITNVESGSRKLEVKSKERNNMLHDTIIQQQRLETTNGQVETTPGIRKMTPGQVETAPGLKKMTHGRVKTAPGMRKTTQGRVETTPGRVEYASGPLPARHSAILRFALTVPITNQEVRSQKSEDGKRLPAGQAGKLEVGRPKLEARSPKTEAGFSSLLNHCSNLPAPLSTLAKGDEIRPLVAGLEGVVAVANVEKENKEHRIRKSEDRSRKREAGFSSLLNHCSNFLAPLSTLAKGDEIRPLVAGSEGVETPEQRKENNEHRIRKSEDRSPKREAGFSSLLNHCSNFLAPLSTLAKGDEIRPLVAGLEGVFTPSNVGKENKKYPPRESSRTITNLEDRRPKSEVGSPKREARSRNLTSNDKPTKFQNSALSPFRQLADGWGEAPHKTLSRLPQESGFVSGECPGAAAITKIITSLFSSPRVSPIFAGFTQTNLPVINCPETGGFLWYCHPAGRYSGQGTSTHPERPLQRTKPERRYAYVLN